MCNGVFGSTCPCDRDATPICSLFGVLLLNWGYKIILSTQQHETLNSLAQIAGPWQSSALVCGCVEFRKRILFCENISQRPDDSWT